MSMKATPSRRSVLLGVGAGLAAAPFLTGCGVTRGGVDPNSRMRMMIPNSPGGGYDQTGRAIVKVMEDDDLTGRFVVFNVTGASGTVAMSRLMNERGNDDLLMSMGLGVVGATYTNKSPARVSKATPIARMIEEQEAVVVPAKSPYKSIEQLIAAWKKDPKKITVGGGSSPGGPDHLFPMELANKSGLDPRKVNFISYDGGGDLLAALLGSKIAFGTTGLAEFSEQIKKGQLRVLAVSGERRAAGIDAPTLQQADIDLTFLNWRGILAPPGISAARQKELVELLRKMHASAAWKKTLKTRDWTDAWLTGDKFGDFLTAQDKRVASTLKGLGLL
jgi:putative tricarboxylic transport membrane protein